MIAVATDIGDRISEVTPSQHANTGYNASGTTSQIAANSVMFRLWKS